MDIFQTQNGERVTSSYAEIFLDDDYCKNKPPAKNYDKESSKDEHEVTEKIGPENVEFQDSSSNSSKSEMKIGVKGEDDWVSPSDTMIGLVECKPPFTSRIIKAKTHEGILNIGEEIIRKEYESFLKYLKTLLDDNDSSWKIIIQQEMQAIKKKAAQKYKIILEEKFKVMQTEVTGFFAQTLDELESHIRDEINKVMTANYASMVSRANFEIQERLKQEKKVLEKILQDRYNSEVKKINHYYEILFNNEKVRYEQLIGEHICDRNDAIRAFTNLVEAENNTNIMYIMSTERRKCTIKKILLEYIQTEELQTYIVELKNKCETLLDYNKRDVPLPEVEKRWQEKIQNLMRLFLKFISFSLKLLPEQATFLLDLEKMVVLQLNEINKSPKSLPILFDEDEIFNRFVFKELDFSKPECDKEPFTVEGNPNPPTPRKYGSTETLNSDVSLPAFRVQRQFIYAKCDKYNEVKAFLNSNKCKCSENILPKSESEQSSEIKKPPTSSTAKVKTPSEESYQVHDRDRYFAEICPSRRCQRWIKRNAFPILQDYLDYTDEQYQRVLSILGKQPAATPCSFPLINPQEIAYREMLFAPTKEEVRNFGTQYSSQESLENVDKLLKRVEDEQEKNLICTCDLEDTKIMNREETINQMLRDQKNYLKNILHNRPELLAMFTDELNEIPNDKVT